MKITKDKVFKRLATVIDPELDIDIVSLGLVYEVNVNERTTDQGKKPFIHIIMTLTTPGCPLAPVIDGLVRSAVSELKGVNPDQDLKLELTFDPPWVPDMMTNEARAELGI